MNLYRYTTAVEVVTNILINEFSGWRLPTIGEVLQLINTKYFSADPHVQKFTPLQYLQFLGFSVNVQDEMGREAMVTRIWTCQNAVVQFDAATGNPVFVLVDDTILASVFCVHPYNRYNSPT